MTENIKNTEYISIEDVSSFIQEMDLDLKVRVSALNLAIAFRPNADSVNDVIEIAGQFEAYLISGVEEKSLPVQDDSP